MSRLLLPIPILLVLLVTGCATSPPRNIDDSCEIFRDKDDWYETTQDVYERWGMPPHVVLAIIHQESKFKYDAKPPREYLLWIIPWFRPSSAYGYAQVKDETWDWYIEKTGNGGADRDEFEDAADFIGWYGDMSHRTLGISKWDAYNQYLAYHEGHGGFKRKSYLKKPWLVQVARKVKTRASRYHTQLGRCRAELESSDWWPFW